MVMGNDYSAVMNHKKIRRLMEKYNLFAKIRRSNPYRKIAKATKEPLLVQTFLIVNSNRRGPRIPLHPSSISKQSEKLGLTQSMFRKGKLLG
nr:hypothetical protein [Peribacillus simplex]